MRSVHRLPPQGIAPYILIGSYRIGSYRRKGSSFAPRAGRVKEEDVRHGRALAVGASLFALTANGLHAEDWPQWRGRDRLAVWRETGIVERFPEDGLKLTWSDIVRLRRRVAE